MITYFKSQKALANMLTAVIDAYWNQQISENEFIEYLKTVYKNNPDKFIVSDNEVAPILKQRLGKKRIGLILQILNTTIKKEDSIT